MNRDESIARFAAGGVWDLLVIGGGATGLGIAVDAASRGYRVALAERGDFAQGTSSRSTKLVHGGVRYLRSGEFGLVRGALRERARMERNAPALVSRRAFVIPVYRRWDAALYGLGLTLYDRLAGAASFGRTERLDAEATRRCLPTVRAAGLVGGIRYYDGQFDDARFAVALARTAAREGATVGNYLRVEALLRGGGRGRGARVRDLETDQSMDIEARVVVNATGVFTDDVRRLDEPGAAPMVTLSSGVHLVLDRAWLPGADALMIPKTSDGRVLFAIPWHGRIVVGTTDERREAAEVEPRPLPREIEFLLRTASGYFERPVTRGDVRSVFTGLRPLAARHPARATSALSRDHVVVKSSTGLISVAGGKWTTYRKMAQDAVDAATMAAGLPSRACRTQELPLCGANATVAQPEVDDFGTDADALAALQAQRPELGTSFPPEWGGLGAQTVWAAQHEMARTVEDVLARRSRLLLLDVRAAVDCAPAVAALLARELGRPAGWAAEQVRTFAAVAETHRLALCPPGSERRSHASRTSEIESSRAADDA